MASEAFRLLSGALGDAGRGLVRYSGTEAKLRVMMEGEDEVRLLKLADDILDAARADIGEA